MPQGGERVRIVLDDGRQLELPADLLAPQPDGTYHLPASLEEPGHLAGGEGQTIRVPVAEEQLRVEKRTRQTGRVSVHITPHERRQVVDEPLIEQSVRIERRPADRIVEKPPPVRQEGEVTIIPVLEEVLVVSKQLRVKEELLIHRERRTVHRPQNVTLRSEEAQVSRRKNPGA